MPQLAPSGFRQVAALDGGLAAWPNALGALEGSQPDASLDVLAPDALHAEALYAHRLVVNASQRDLADPELLAPNHLRTAIGAGLERFRSVVARAVDART